MLHSDFTTLCAVRLPYQGRQKYMMPFNLAAPIMLEGYEDYLEPVVSLCRAAGADKGTAYLTVDEKVVKPGMSQRKPGPHVDGCFMPERMDWSHPGGPGWAHYCNNVPYKRMPIIVAASVAGCKAWRGRFDAQPKSDGDLSHITDQLAAANSKVLPANVGYLLSPDCVHESMIFVEATRRTFLRIALPTEYRFTHDGRSNPA